MESRLRRLSHVVPSWVKDGAVYHIRIRIDSGWDGSLADGAMGMKLLESVAFYQANQIWNCRLIVLMPDHLHALISFNPEREMSKVIGAWKHYHAAQLGVCWQQGYFDHRIRSNERLEETAHYIRENPVAKGLCEKAELWPWVWDGGDWM